MKFIRFLLFFITVSPLGICAASEQKEVSALDIRKLYSLNVAVDSIGDQLMVTLKVHNKGNTFINFTLDQVNLSEKMEDVFSIYQVENGEKTGRRIQFKNIIADTIDGRRDVGFSKVSLAPNEIIYIGNNVSKFYDISCGKDYIFETPVAFNMAGDIGKLVGYTATIEFSYVFDCRENRQSKFVNYLLVRDFVY